MLCQKNSMIYLNDFRAQWDLCGGKVLSAIERVGKSGWYILGGEVELFEKRLAKLWGLRAAVGCASGLDAIEIGLRALGLKPGEKVLTTPLSAFATSLAIIRAGGIPVFADVDDQGLIDLKLCKEAFKKDPSIRYFVPVHLYGHPLSLQLLSDLKTTYGLKVVEDCAQAIGAKGAGLAGDVAATSFYPTKNLGCMGDGGALLTNDPSLEIKIRRLRDYGQAEKYVHTDLGLNSRLDELQAAILQEFLPQLQTWTARRTQIAEKYQKEIRHPLIRLPKATPGSVWHLFPVLIEKEREEFQRHLQSMNIQTGRHYPFLIPRQKALENAIEASPLEKAQYFADHEVSLPIHPFLTDEAVSFVIEACNRWQR